MARTYTGHSPHIARLQGSGAAASPGARQAESRGAAAGARPSAEAEEALMQEPRGAHGQRRLETPGTC